MMPTEKDRSQTETDLSLRVAEALPKDVGRGLVRLDPEDLGSLGIAIGDTVAIRGKRSTVARAMPAYADQRGQSLIQMDGILRANAGAGLDERVAVQRIEAQTARAIVLSPLEAVRSQPGTAQTRYLARLMDGIPVVDGDRIRVNLIGTPLASSFSGITGMSTTVMGRAHWRQRA